MLSLEQTQFNGKILEVVEDELHASIRGDVNRILRQRFYDEWCMADKPKNIKAWLRPRLKPLFPCLDKKPVWVEDVQVWPFFDGMPMTFVGQLDVPGSDGVVYIFTAKKPHATRENVWSMHYEVVEQVRSLKGVVAVQDNDGNFKLVKKTNR